jgi:predicted MFS family arabinose efflux permease
MGSLFGGFAAQRLQQSGFTPLQSQRVVVELYAGAGVLLTLLFTRLSRQAEPQTSSRSRWGLGKSRGVVLKLSGLMALDAFGGAMVIQSFAAYWFYLRFGVKPATIGAIFFGANLFAGISALVAVRLAARFGLVRTMVFTHLPSNILLILVPLMPNLPLAIAVLLARFSISQMDVPTRQSYSMAIVQPEERSATAGITGVARTTGAALGPIFVGMMLDRPGAMDWPFYIAGAAKIIYDLLLYRAFVKVAPPEERQA